MSREEFLKAHKDRCARTSQETIAVAKILQLAAFNDPSDMSPGRKIAMDPESYPAPVYLEQAIALHDDPSLRAKLMGAISVFSRSP